MRAVIAGLTILILAGCGQQVGRYQMVLATTHNEFWRIDTATGEIAKCIWAGGPKATCSSAP